MRGHDSSQFMQILVCVVSTHDMCREDSVARSCKVSLSWPCLNLNIYINKFQAYELTNFKSSTVKTQLNVMQKNKDWMDSIIDNEGFLELNCVTPRGWTVHLS